MACMAARICISVSCLSFALLGSCTTVNQSGACVPGASVACACPAGQQSAQTCNSAGTFDVCQCSISAAIDAAPDVPKASLDQAPDQSGPEVAPDAWGVGQVTLEPPSQDARTVADLATTSGPDASPGGPCVVNGVTYQPGQSFTLNCLRWTCAGGGNITGGTGAPCSEAGAAGGAGGTGGIGLSGTGGAGGAGGSSTGPDAGTSGEAGTCGITPITPNRASADVLIVLDRSGSMAYSIADDCSCDASLGTLSCPSTLDCTDRWTTLMSAVNTTLASTSGSINWGLKLFASPGGSNNCSVSAGVEVPIGANSAATIQQQIASVSPGGYTPTAKAIIGATTYLNTVADSNNKVILLATDGEPNCMGTSENTNDDAAGATTAIMAAYQSGYKVYVVGLGPQETLGNLQTFALAGGTTTYYPATSPQGLSDALATIAGVVSTTCTFQTPTPPSDQSEVFVYVDGKLIPDSTQDPVNGWTFGATPSTYVLTGSYCADMLAGVTSALEIIFGCPGYVPPVVIH